MRNAWIHSNHKRTWLPHQCTFVEKIALVSNSHFLVIKIILKVQMFIDIVEFKWKKKLFFTI